MDQKHNTDKNKKIQPTPFYTVLSQNNYIEEGIFEFDLLVAKQKKLVDEYNREYNNIEDEEFDDDEIFDELLRDRKSKMDDINPLVKQSAYLALLKKQLEQFEDSDDDYSDDEYDDDFELHKHDYDARLNTEGEVDESDEEELDEDEVQSHLDYVTQNLYF
ncbi:hypothetical protein [Carp edema virus]|nr:hypothetical protein [Carp edema virus]